MIRLYHSVLLCLLSLSFALYGPYSTVDPGNAHRKHVDHSLKLSKFWGDNIKAPYPTNIWWLNLVMANGDQTISTFPYLHKVKSDAYCFTFPKFIETKVFVLGNFLDEWCYEIGSAEHKVTDYNDMGVVVDYMTSGTKKVSIPLTQGANFVIAEFNNYEVKARTIMALLEIKDATGRIYHPEQSPVTQPSNKYIMKMNNDHVWVMYFEKPVSVSFRVSYFSVMGLYTGSVKFSILENDNQLSQLDQYSGAYAVGGTVEYEINDTTAKYTYKWNKKGTGDLMMLALPHHIEGMSNPKILDKVAFRSIRGKVKGVVGNEWLFYIELPKYLWDSPKPIEPSKIPRIKQALESDYSYMSVEPDPYFFGVGMGRMARLALIADQLGEDDKARKIRENMKACLLPWLLGENPDSLLYDHTYGGIVSKKGVKDFMEDFGNGYYNDHHFHYGYPVYAAAAIGRKDKDFLNKYKEEILTYVRDYANPSKEDKYFAVARNKDWFGWHSWAAGLFEFADGRNQESTSEGIMCYYGLMLLGEALNNTEMRNFGRFLLATEIKAAQTYWHVPSKSDIYPEVFKPNKMVGVLWSTKVDYATFFGGNPIFIHGIQMLPFLPPTETCLDKEFIKEEYEVIKTENSPADWMPYKLSAKAIIDPASAWEETSKLTEFHLGTCMTIVLHWIATRP